MLSSLLKRVSKKVSTLLLTSVLIYNPGCAYQSLRINEIPNINPPEIVVMDFDYTQLTSEEVIKYIKTPKKVQHYLDHHLETGEFEKGESFAENHLDRKGLCIDYALAAAALLSDDGYKANILILSQRNTPSHALFLYKENDHFGVLGNSSIPARYGSINELVKAISEKNYWDFYKYAIVDLDATFPDKDWIDKSVNFKLYYPKPTSFIRVK